MQTITVSSAIPHVAVNANALEAIKRKDRSERILDSEGVPVNPDLPLIQHASECHPRGKEEVAHRALSLLMTAIKAEGMDQTMLLRVIRQYGLAAHFSPAEKEFIRNVQPDASDKVFFVWNYESAWALLWALGYVDGFGTPNSTCEATSAVAYMRERSTRTFIKEASLRPFSQIADQADLTYRYHWSVDEAQRNGKDIPAGLIAGVVRARRRALDWLTCVDDKHWDELGLPS